MRGILLVLFVSPILEAYENGVVDQPREYLVISEHTRDNLLLRPIKAPKPMTENFKRRDFARDDKDEFDALRGKEIRRKPKKQTQPELEPVDTEDPEIAKIMSEMAVQNETAPHFARNSYELAATAEILRQSKVLALLTFVSPIGGDTPIFSVTTDPLNILTIGAVRTKQRNNELVSSVPVVLRKNISIDSSEILDDVYAFGIKAQSGEFEDTAVIRMKVLEPANNVPRPKIEATPRPDAMGEEFNRGVIEIQPPVLKFVIPNDKGRILEIQLPVENGVTIKDFEFSVIRVGEDKSGKIALWTDKFSPIVPAKKHVISGEPIGLLIKNADTLAKLGEFDLTLSAELFGEHFRKRIHIVVKAETREEVDEGSGELIAEDLFVAKPLNSAEAPSDQWRMVSVEASASAEPQDFDLNLKTFVFTIVENAADGTIVGELDDLRGYYLDDELPFELRDSMITVKCENIDCLDYERQSNYDFYLVPRSGSISRQPIRVIVKLDDVNEFEPSFEASDKVIRISNGDLLTPFALEITDLDKAEEDAFSLQGTAANFIKISKVDKKLFELKVSAYPTQGVYELTVTLSDQTGKFEPEAQTFKVIVQNTESKAHFRKSKYEKTITSTDAKNGRRLIELELEGVPIDSVKFMILGGNPGWITIDDYHGHVSIDKLPKKALASEIHTLKIGAVSRTSSVVLAQCDAVISVRGEAKDESPFVKALYSFEENRETSGEIVLPLELTDASAQVQVSSVRAIDNDGVMSKMDTKDTKMYGNLLRIPREAVQALRVLQIALSSGRYSGTVIVQLTSTREYLEEKDREMNRPLFARPWSPDNTIIEATLYEEAPIGTPVLALPANNPITGKSSRISLSGKDAAKFSIQQGSGVLSVNQRLDFESLKPEDRHLILELTSGENKYKCKAVVRVKLLDLDDNAPKFNTRGLPSELRIAENAKPGTEVLPLKVNDADAITGGRFTYRVSGVGNEKFVVIEKRNHAVLVVAPGARLDREAKSSYELKITVVDPAGNTDSIPIVITLLDENDNAPQFDQTNYEIQAVENWPEGAFIAQFFASDADDRQLIEYSLDGPAAERLNLDPETGVLSLASELSGLARQQPYELNLTASDNGNPPLNSTITLKLIVASPQYIADFNRAAIQFSRPENDFVLRIPENKQVGQPVYNVHAVANAPEGQTSMHVKYLALPMRKSDEGYVDVDEHSGDVFVTGEIDFERVREIQILLRAFNELSPNVSTERLLRIEVLDEDDNAPEFVQSNSLVFPVSLPVMASSHVGKLQAFDRDAAPNNEFFYYLLPSCNMNFADALMIAEVTGELSTMRKIADLPNNAAEFCALVSPYPSLHVADVEFDAKNASMLKFKLREFREEAKVLRLDLYPNNTVLTIDPELSNFELPVTLPVSIPSYTAFSAAQITYDPAIFVQAKPALSASQLFSVDPANGVVRVSPRISEQSEGVYSIKVQALDTARQTVIGNYSHMVHCVADDTKLRFVFGLSLKQLTQRKSSLINDLGEALAADVDNLMVVADQMDKVMTNGFMERSSLCVHATQAGRLMSRDSLHAIITTALKKADSPLSSFYITYKVNDVESCATVHFQHSKRQQNAQSVLLLSCVFCAAVLTTIAACSYFCLLKRYQSYLRMKEQKLSMGTQRRMPMPPPPSFSPMY